MIGYMKCSLRAITTAFLISLGACAGFGATPVKIGDTESDVIAKMGKPTHRYDENNGHLLEYARGPWGQQTYMARIDSNGQLISFEQVLTNAKFCTLKVGQATKTDVLHTIGAPSETSFLSLSQLEVWSYPYKESGVWDSIMHVHFDKQGVVRQMMSGPDPSRDPDSRWPFGRRHR